MKMLVDFSEYKPWSGAVDTYRLIEDAGKLEALENFLEDYFHAEVPTNTKINDLLWFDSDFVLSALSISVDD